MDISVIVCTRNRARSLARTLAAFERLEIPTGLTWEVVVVDNGSEDDTAGVVEAAAARLPVRRVSQPIAGLSNARNAGVGAALGALHLCTDDDVVTDLKWLSAYVAAAAANPTASVFGGPSRPVFEAPQTPWFVAAAPLFSDLLAVRNFGPTPRPLTHDDIPYGLNYAIRREAHRSHPYDPNLGVAPGRRRGGEEIAVMRAILAEGMGGVWVPDAKVDHMIPAERQTEAYLLQFYTANGEEYPVPVAGLAATALGLSVGLALRRLRYLAKRRLGDAAWVGDLMAYAKFKGTVAVLLGKTSA